MNKLPAALALIGPTASGKTAMAMALAEKLPIEIVSMDSALVYQGMDIGTAKPTLAERFKVVHHLLDMVSPTENYSAAQFAQHAAGVIHEISSQKKLPLIVGGTLLYFRALVEGLNPLPSANEAVRQEIGRLKDKKGLAGLYAQLQQVDAPTAARLQANDSQRIERALEVFLISNRPMSDWLKAKRSKPVVNIKSCALVPEPRSQLHQIIQNRFNQMIQVGFVDEVRNLQYLYPALNANMPSMRCVGYRQIWSYLAGEINREQMIEKGVIATRQLAKRQLTWLRNMALDLSINPYQNQHDLPPELFQAALNCMQQNQKYLSA